MDITSLAIIGPSANDSSRLGGDYTGFSEKKDCLSLILIAYWVEAIF
jgi:hypothetical protein